MKLFIVMCVIVAASCAVPITKIDTELIKDFEEFYKCFDVNQAIIDINDAVQNNDGVKEFIAYMTTDDFKKTVEGIDTEISYRAILSDLEDHGLPAYDTVNEILKALNITPIPPPSTANDGSIDRLFNKLEENINSQCVEQTYQNLLKKDEFEQFIAHINQPGFKDLVFELKNSKGLKDAIEEFGKHGFHVRDLVQLFKNIFHIDI